MVVSAGDVITPKDLPPAFISEHHENGHEPNKIEVGLTLAEAEHRLILQTLSSTNNNRTRAAKILGITAKTLYNKLKQETPEPAILN